MTEQTVVANLTTKAVRVLLALLLRGSGETQYRKSEFASLTGVPGQSIPGALVELENVGLISIVTHKEAYEKATNTVVPPPSTSPTLPVVLELPAQEEDEEVPGEEGVLSEGTHVDAPPPAPADSNMVLEVVAHTTYGKVPDEEVQRERSSERLLELCVIADTSKLRDNQVDALQGCWNYAFPYEKYPLQRLQPYAAKEMLKGHTAEEVGKIILKAGERVPPIEWPKSYIEAALTGIDKRRGETESEGDPINDELRALARLGNEQYGNKKAGSTWFS